MNGFDIICLMYSIKYFLLELRCFIYTYTQHNEKDRPND